MDQTRRQIGLSGAGGARTHDLTDFSSKRQYRGRMTGETKKKIKTLSLIALVAVFLYLQNGWRHLGYTGTPDQVEVCERSYMRPGNLLTRDEVLKNELVVVGTVQVWFRHLTIWGMEPSYYRTGNLSCGGSVYVEFSENEFREYTISGGF